MKKAISGKRAMKIIARSCNKIKCKKNASAVQKTIASFHSKQVVAIASATSLHGLSSNKFASTVLATSKNELKPGQITAYALGITSKKP